MVKLPVNPFNKAGEMKTWANDIMSAAKSTIGEVVSNIKESTDEYGRKQAAAKREKEYQLLKPVFPEMLARSEFPPEYGLARRTGLPAMIHVAEKDKKHSESDLCDGSVGHLSVENGVAVLTVYPEHLNEFGISLFPDTDREIYYVDPCLKDQYIDIAEYFRQLKSARVTELEHLAYALGAKHFEIIFKTDTLEKESLKKAAGLQIKRYANVSADTSRNSSKAESVEVERSIDLDGHDDPQVPELVYFKNDPDIQNLIRMRMDKKAGLRSKECKIRYSNSSGIKASDAARIQSAINGMGASTSILSESLNESCTTLIYKIEF